VASDPVTRVASPGPSKVPPLAFLPGRPFADLAFFLTPPAFASIMPRKVRGMCGNGRERMKSAARHFFPQF